MILAIHACLALGDWNEEQRMSVTLVDRSMDNLFLQKCYETDAVAIWPVTGQSFQDTN